MHDWPKLPFFEHTSNFADKHFINISHTHRLHASYCFFSNTQIHRMSSYQCFLVYQTCHLKVTRTNQTTNSSLKLKYAMGFSKKINKIELGSSSCLRTSHSSSAAAHQPFILFPHATTPCSELFHSWIDLSKELF